MKKILLLILFLSCMPCYTSCYSSPLAQAIKVFAIAATQRKSSLIHSIPANIEIVATKVHQELASMPEDRAKSMPNNFPVAIDEIFFDDYFLTQVMNVQTKAKTILHETKDEEKESTMHTISRQEARTKIKQCTLTFIDLNDYRTIQEHVEDLEAMIPYLDPEQDQSTIQFIRKFKDHKNITYLATARWANMLYNISKDLPDDAPVHPDLWKYGYSELVQRINHRCNCK